MVSVEDRRAAVAECSTFEELWDYIFDEDVRVSSEALRSSVMDWNYLEDIIYSEKFRPELWVEVEWAFYRWNSYLENFDYVRFLAFFEDLIDSGKLSPQIVNSTIDCFTGGAARKWYRVGDPVNQVRKAFAESLPSFFVERLYDLFTPQNDYVKGTPLGYGDGISCLYFVGCPTVGEEFKQRVWEEWGKVFCGFAQKSWLKEEALLPFLYHLSWEDFPRNIIYDFFVSCGNSYATVDDFFVKYRQGKVVWRDVLLENLAVLFPHSNLEALPSEWLHELALSNFCEPS